MKKQDNQDNTEKKINPDEWKVRSILLAVPPSSGFEKEKINDAVKFVMKKAHEVQVKPSVLAEILVNVASSVPSYTDSTIKGALVSELVAPFRGTYRRYVIWKVKLS